MDNAKDILYAVQITFNMLFSRQAQLANIKIYLIIVFYSVIKFNKKVAR